MKTCVGLFAGIGGMELGMHSAGFNTEMLAEIMPEAQMVLRSKFEGVEIRPDVTKIRSLPRDLSILCAGFPCQDLSSSGQKLGLSGFRSSLVGEVFRLLSSTNCDWVLFENVKFMLHLAGGEAMTMITKELESLGFRWAYRVMNSQNFGVPQRRERVYLLASRRFNPAGVLFREPLVDSPAMTRPNDVSAPVGFYWTEGRYATGLAADALPPLKGGSTIGIPSAPAILFPDGRVGTPDLRDAERLQGFDEDWTIAAEQNAKASSRWKLVGNAVTVSVCEWIAAGLDLSGEGLPEDALPTTTGRWPDAAFGERGKVWRVYGAYGPANRVSLASFLRYPTKPLSRRAVNGFIGRAQAGKLRYPLGFVDSLIAYSRGL